MRCAGENDEVAQLKQNCQGLGYTTHQRQRPPVEFFSLFTTAKTGDFVFVVEGHCAEVAAEVFLFFLLF